jgi:hypothetical protein
MNTRFLAWGVTGGVSLLLATACGGTKVNDVGDVNEGGSANTAGSAGNGNVGANDGIGGIPYGPDTSSGGCSGNGSDYVCTGTAGTNTAGNYGASGAPTDCFAPINSYWEQPPPIADQNTVFIDAHTVMPETAKNTAEQQIFTNQTWIVEAYANFPASAAAPSTTLDLPGELSQVSANLGQLYLTRPSCSGKPAGGHKLTVEFWWKLGGAITAFPTHGVALGAVAQNGQTSWFDDSAKKYTVGAPQTDRLMNTLGRLKVEHTFAEDDETDAGKIALGVWLLPDTEFASTFYVGNVKWD